MDSDSSLISGAQHVGSKVEMGVWIQTTCYDIMLNYQFFQKFKLLGNDKFNHLIIILIQWLAKHEM